MKNVVFNIMYKKLLFRKYMNNYRIQKQDFYILHFSKFATKRKPIVTTVKKALNKWFENSYFII